MDEEKRKKLCICTRALPTFFVRSSDALVPSVTQYCNIFYLSLVL